MANEMQIFQNGEFGELEVVDVEGKPYFPAKQCAEMLGYKNPRDAIAKHCKPDGVVKRDGVSFTENQYGAVTEQTVEKTYISEGNLYRLIVRSKLPTAERFEKWVFDDVIPSIRKHKIYAPDELLAPGNEDFLISAIQSLKAERENNKRLEKENARLAVPAAKYEGLFDGSALFESGQIAKEMGMTAQELNRYLKEWRVIYKPCGSDAYQLYSEYKSGNYAVTRPKNCNGFTIQYLYWTAKGRDFIFDLVDEHLGGAYD